jgi:HSP20 family protein
MYDKEIISIYVGPYGHIQEAGTLDAYVQVARQSNQEQTLERRAEAMLELMSIGPRNPWTIFDELESLQADMNRILSGEDPARALRRSRTVYPPLNVWSGPDGLVVDAELPGVDPQDVEISVVGDELELSGKVNVQPPAEGETVLRRERPAGEFRRTLALPFRADTGAVKATFKNGLLRISVPRSAEEKPRKIAIEAT